ncbi:hypothetical protein JNUCC42_15150 [Brevibacterium sp. JNUCC-42]|nr:hypothetical protein JNUCC42_15150 [Brevibacterium sp. JNUCC-42]
MKKYLALITVSLVLLSSLVTIEIKSNLEGHYAQNNFKPYTDDPQG